MENKHFSTSFRVDQTPEQVFDAISNVRGWWTENMEGRSYQLNDVFTVRFDDVHVSTQKLIEVVPSEKIVWLVTDSNLNFIEDKQEWTNTKIYFRISGDNGKTRIDFSHEGLSPGVECYEACSNAWSDYLQGSLLRLITTGKGEPAPLSARL